MATTRETARRLVRAHELTPRQTESLRAERTLVLQGVPAGWSCDHGGCTAAAMYALRSAMEIGGTVIEIQRGTHRHRFDVVDLLQHRARSYGVPARPTGLPAIRGILGQRAAGNTFDVSRPMFPVPVTVVSGNVPATKETIHGQ